MNHPSERAIAVVALGAILPDAQNPNEFWGNILSRRYSIREVPSNRWDPGLYYDPDPMAPDKTYSKIGGWVERFDFNWRSLHIPPKVAAAMDEGQKWALAITAQALEDYGYPNRPLDLERTAVVFGTAMGGEMHYLTTQRISFPEIAQSLENVTQFSTLAADTRQGILKNWEAAFGGLYPPVTEDSMPGELANIISGRVANVFNFRGPNFITDAACAASFAAVEAAIALLLEGKADAVLTGGVDHNMGASSFVKFCKIGALSATGSRPFGTGADGFVMGEGAGAFLLKRLADAERDGDRIYAVIRGIGGASDGKGKGIYAPNPIGQQLAMQRAWQAASLDPATATLVEAHGTSTRVGDVVEVESLAKVFCGAPPRSIALGSVKSNIGHLKAGAGAAGLLKTILALHHKTIPPTLNADPPNPDIDFRHTPFNLALDARDWGANGTPRRAGASAYGFGGTNFHAVLEEYIPGLLTRGGHSYQGVSVRGKGESSSTLEPAQVQSSTGKTPVRGILALGTKSPEELKEQIEIAYEKVRQAGAPPIQIPDPKAIMSQERLVIDYGNEEELLDRLEKARRAFALDSLPVWKALQPQGIFRGTGPKPGKIAFLFPGQGSQYTNMGRALRELDPLVAEVFADGDRVMAPILEKPLSSYIFPDSLEPAEVQAAELNLMQTEICQPAMLTMDTALYKLLGDYGITPSMVMGHSLGEYAALIAAGVMPFEDALEAVAARGREMAAFHSGIEDNGWMAAVMAPLAVIQETLAGIDGYVVTANINSYNQCVIGGASRAVEQAIQAFQEAGYEARRIPVSHAFHTKIVAPASRPLRQVLNRLRVFPPQIPIIANVTGEVYPQNPEEIRDLLEQQVASPVQWVKGLETLYGSGVRIFVEVGPKKALKGLVDDVLGNKPDLVSLFTNHPKVGELATFNQALCGLYAAGFGAHQPDEFSGNGKGAVTRGRALEDEREGGINPDSGQEPEGLDGSMEQSVKSQIFVEGQPSMVKEQSGNGNGRLTPTLSTDLAALGRLLVEAIQENGQKPKTVSKDLPYDRNTVPLGSVVITGTGLGLPGAEKRVMDPDNVQRILKGEEFIDLIPERFRQKVLEKRITRVVKAEDGNGRLELIQGQDEVIRLAGRPGGFDLVEEYGVPEKLVEALDITTQLAMAAGLDSLREAGIPLVLTYRQTTTGKYLPDRWILPEALRDETGVIFASAFPGGDRLADEFSRFYTYQNRVEQIQFLEDLRQKTQDEDTLVEILRRINALQDDLQREPYEFDRRFIFRILAMGHSQFAEFIGARGPNTHINAACASTTLAIALAEDWIRHGRCRRVIVIAGDNATGTHLLEWIGAGLLATGALATDDCVEEAALPFDRRRHGTIMGMGACALVLESEDVVRERGMRGITELLSSEASNSAYHGTRLDIDHISQVMDNLLTSAEQRFGIQRQDIAPQAVFISHETYTPARGGSASAEVFALRKNFGPAADELIISNTKGFTGHSMGVGIEDVIAVKILEHGIVPPVPNHRERDPELGDLNLSKGGRYPVKYALHLAAGFGSQVAMVLLRRIPGKLDRVDQPGRYQYWLAQVSGYDRAETEIYKRTLRVKDQGNPTHPPAPSNWQYGTGPCVRAEEYGRTTNDGRRTAVEDDRRWTADDRRQTTNERSQRIDEARNEKPEPQGEPPSASIIRLSPTSNPITEKVLAIVAEKTGYPADMLELDLDLEADLGIDTVKQAETFLALREAFDIARQENLKLRDYPTLAKVIEFVKEMRPDLVVETTDDRRQTTDEIRNEISMSQGEPPSSSGMRPSSTSDPVTEKVLAIVAEKTGYPADMLELDLDLEADLGIDTVKQAETFLALREAFNIPRQENLKLRDYPTLGHVIGFVKGLRPDLVEETTDGGRQTTGEGSKPNDDSQNGDLIHRREQPSSIVNRPSSSLEAADRFPRRVPLPVLRPALELCKPSGIQLEEGTRVIVATDSGRVGEALSKRLGKRSVKVLTLDSSLSQEALKSQLAGWIAEGLVDGVYWLPALDIELGLEDLNADSWKTLNRQRVKNLFLTMQALVSSEHSQNAFLVAATRLGGLHGYGPVKGTGSILGGGVTGFTKAYHQETPGTLVKAVDFEAGRKPGELAETLIAETLQDPDLVEVGYWQDGRYSIGLAEQPAADGNPGLSLGRETVFLVTGAAGGITSAIVADLAAASGGYFYLIDLAPLPDPQDRHIQLFRQSREALKASLIESAKAAGKKSTPAEIEKEILWIERQEAALRSMEAVRAAGGQADYRSVDLFDGAAVNRVIEEVRQRHGRIDVIIHAAGVELSRSLADKDPAQFDLVYGVKTEGIYNLLRPARGLPIGALVCFSSVAGRFGNAGQTDYSAANDLLCKLVSSLPDWRPGTRGLAIDWTAWAGIGMATRGSIPKVMEYAGIETLPPEVGIPTVRRELVSGCRSGEVVVAGKLGILIKEPDDTGGLDAERASTWMGGKKHPGAFIGSLKAAPLAGEFQVELELDPKFQPFLYDHAMDGVPLLPGVMGTEAFAELANQAAPGYQVVAVENESFERAFKFFNRESQRLYFSMKIHPIKDGELLAESALCSRRVLPGKGGEIQEKVHFRADVRLRQELPAQPRIPPPEKPAHWQEITASEIYRIFFHGPAFQVLESVYLNEEQAIGIMKTDLPPLTNPAGTNTLMAPRLIELCLQTVGIWELKTKAQFALPSKIASVAVWGEPLGAGERERQFMAIVHASKGAECFDAQVVDEQGKIYVDLKGYQTVNL